ncbi:MAG TPA: hypothetical protein RMH99_13735 [Sandaracinaceae bacterium LLY-WYZ-13_1]|nr:hypothetical protein [Sandaracinaceae bacterium LLY-WYZ-13_1]
MSEPRPAELDAFVDVLRGATPDAELLAEAREGVVAHATPPTPGAAGGATLHALRLAMLGALLWALAHPHGAPGHPKLDGPSASSAIEASAKPPRSGRTAAAGAGAPAGDAARLWSGRPGSSAPETGPVGSSAPAPNTSEPNAPGAPVAGGASSRSADGARAATTDAGDATDGAPGKLGGIARTVPDLPLQIDPGPVPVMDTTPSAPSETMASAMRDYARERYPEAAVKLQRVVEGATGDGAERVTQAEFFLAKCLYHLGLYHASAAAFDEVTRRGRAHPYFDESLRWIAMLAEHLPEPSGVIGSVSRYDEERLARLDTPETRGHHQHLSFLLGRARYRDGRLEEAVRAFRRVPTDSPHGLEARFFEGVTHVRRRRAQPAEAAFRRVIEAVRAGRTGGHEAPERMHHLAWMSLARLYYTQAMALPEDRDEEASTLLSHAVAAWRRIPLSSEYWLDSFFEETWALYIAREHPRALGHVHALESPYFRDRADPEALVVRAMIQLEHCQWDAVEHTLAGFHERYDPVLRATERAHALVDSHEDGFRMLAAVRARNSRVPPAARPSVRAAFDDRELVRHLAQVRSVTAEQARLAALDAPLLESSLHPRVAADLAILRSLAIDRAGELAQARLRRLVEDLRERMSQMDTVELELATARRDELTRPNPRPMEPPEGGRIWAVQGDQRWPWDGEWWRDELPFYHQEIRNRCGR